MTPEAYREVEKIVDGVVAKPSKRWPWVGEEELRQEGWAAALAALPSWKSEKGPIGPYLGTCVRRRIARFVAESYAPISARGHCRSSMAALLSRRGAMPRDVEEEGDSLEDRLDAARTSVARVGRLMELVGDDLLRDLVGEVRPRRKAPRDLVRRRLEALAVIREELGAP